MEIASSWNFNGVPVTHKCDLCLEHKTQTPIPVNDTNIVCRDCFISELKPKFEAARESEQSWPVTFGTIIHPSSFAEFFAPDFIDAYIEKEKEYNTPINSRVYCASVPCGKFLGSSGAHGASTLTCTCGVQTCEQCRAATQQTGAHVCQDEEAPVTTALEGLQLGRHYQLCPRCQIPVELRDACNLIQCRCGQEFCFVCGIPASSDSGHWRPGGCPRWNHADAANAQYDNDQPQQAHVDDVYHHVEQLRPDRGPVPAMLAQAMDALAVDPLRPMQQPQQHPPPPRPPPRWAPQAVPTPEQQRSRTEAQRRAANDMAARMGFMPARPNARR